MEEIPASGIGDNEIDPGIQEQSLPSPETPSEIEHSSQDSDFTTSDSDDDSSDEDPLDQEYDLATTILNEIKDETYICLICTCEVGPGGKFWSCGDCYRVYHMSCIESWSKKGSSTDAEGNWKCPACNTKHAKQKFQHKCWCKKTLHPQNNPLNPGSCGQSCGVPLSGCIHKCPLPCHPGPHAECNALGPIMKCRCGNHDNQWPCVMTPYLDGWQCEDICEELLPCEVHKCGKNCHDGLCGKCEQFIESKCYCGKTTDHIKCHSKQPKKSFGVNKEDNWIGNFKCSISSEITYDCGIHSELKECTSVKRKAVHCLLSPDVIKNCPCGQTLIEELNEGFNRRSCTDAIPTCEKVCGKTLGCGHKCKWLCHEGECSPCYENPKSECQCGFNTFITPCKFLIEYSKPSCSRKCTSLLSCRRHRCNRICCPDEKDAMNRERLRKKGIRHNTISTNNSGNRDNEAFNIEASHICLQICNKKLSCGNPDHLCQQTCHTGPCPPCLESSNDDLICHCSQTVVMAPVRCGTQLPACYSQCMRELPCGHQQMPHNCHTDDVQCSRCTKTVEKWCNCGKKKLKAMCYQTEVFCAETCGKLLPCQHHCISNCHSGQCACRSICGKKKKYCSHVDRSPCHFPSRCNDSVVCNEMVKLTCKCGRIKKDIPCGASASKASCEGTTLECDVSCIVQERQEQLEAAFGVSKLSTEPRVKVEDLPYTPETLKTYKLQTRWCSNIEDIIQKFMKSKESSYHFKPMRKEQRHFVHEISDAYKLFSESQDPDPRRSVFIMKREDSITSPLSLEKSLEIYEQHLKETAKASKRTSPEVQDQEQFDHNAIIIEDCVPGVTRPELEEAVIPIMKESPLIKNPRFYWIEADKYLVLPEGHMKVTRTVENELKLLIPTLKTNLSTKFLANTVRLASVDSQFNIVAVEQ